MSLCVFIATLKVVILSVIILSVIMLNLALHSVVVPLFININIWDSGLTDTWSITMHPLSLNGEWAWELALKPMLYGLTISLFSSKIKPQSSKIKGFCLPYFAFTQFQPKTVSTNITQQLSVLSALDHLSDGQSDRLTRTIMHSIIYFTFSAVK